MTDKWNQRPSVPSSSRVTTQGSWKHDNGAEGAKNLWVRTGCQWKLKICTYNARSLSSDDRLHELEDELDRINFDIVGICETRRKGEGCLTLNKSGHQFYYKGGSTHQNGIGFIVNENTAGNVTSFKGISDRVVQLIIKINSKYHLNIIQAYLPTSSHTNEEVDTVYEETDNLVNNKAYYNIVMGDFNAKTGQGNASELGTGPYGLSTRNDQLRRKTPIEDYEHNGQEESQQALGLLNACWTWISPNGHTKTLSSQTGHTPLQPSRSSTASTQAQVRGSLTINTKLERARLIQRCKKPNTAVLSANTTKYQTLLSNRFEALANINRPQLRVRERHLCNY